MKKTDFVHLHLHSQYSLLDGFIKFPELMKLAKEFGMRAVALTDHGNLYGIVDFYLQAIKSGIKPIIGMECYIAPGSRFDRKKEPGLEEYAFHLILLAMDNEGLKNLYRISSIGYTEGFYYRPRIDTSVLEKYNKGLIATSACLQGEIPFYLLKGEVKKAEEALDFYLSVFGKGRFYLELMDNGLEEQRKVNEEIIKLSGRFSVPVIATADVHYLTRDEALTHEILLCIQTNKKITDPDRFRFKSDEFYFKSPEEMERAFSHVEGAIKNTREIAEICAVEFDFNRQKFPHYEIPEGKTKREYFEEKIKEGLKRRLEEKRERGEDFDESVYWERLNYEADIIEKMGFEEYFLIVEDIVSYARKAGIPVGPGRGSAAGSIVAYAIGVTQIDPIKFGLVFERFLNPERVTLPDIDVDFCAQKRDEVIEYVRKRFGEDRVAFVGTFQTIKAKQAVRDVCRVFGLSTEATEKYAKLIPNEPNLSLKELLETDEKLKELCSSNEEARKIFTTAKNLEFTVRQAGTHAGGIVITPGPFMEELPIFCGKDGKPTTQFNKDVLDKLGYIKFDLLALDTITAVYECRDWIKETRGIEIDPLKIPFDDKETYDMLSRGETQGVFQLSKSSSMISLVRRLKPSKFEDIIAILALHRPGPLQSGWVDRFIKRKHGQEKTVYPFPSLEKVLKETYGLILYQEQVMEIARTLSGFTMAEADMLRYAIGKKVQEQMELMRDRFISGAVERGYDREKVEELFESIRKFADYSFNKSHSTVYAYLAYWTAYLKAHFPVEFFTSLLNTSIGKQNDMIKYVNAVKEMGIEILPPDVNRSTDRFTIEEGKIRFCLTGIKNVGVNAVEEIMLKRKERPFSSLLDFLSRVDSRKINKRVVESLVKAGAFDFTGLKRSQLYDAIEEVMNLAGKTRGMRSQIEMFETQQLLPQFNFKPLEEWNEFIKLKYEKEVLGVYLSGHPLQKEWQSIKPYVNSTADEIASGEIEREEVIVAGIAVDFEVKKSKKGNSIGTLILEDPTGVMEIFMFEDVLKKLPEEVNDRIFVVRGKIDYKSENLSRIVASDVMPFEKARKVLTKTAHIKVRSLGLSEEDVEKMRSIIDAYRGNLKTYLHLIYPDNSEVILKLSQHHGISFSEEFVEIMKREFDAEVFYSG